MIRTCSIEGCKTCTGCGVSKPLSGFHASKRAKGQRKPRGGLGVQAECKDCRSAKRNPTLAAQRAEKATLTAQGLKRCSVCSEALPFAKFSARKASPDGLAYKCVKCNKAKLADWRKDNPDGFKRWYADHSAERADYWQEWYEKNKDHRAASYAEWAKANPDIVRTVGARRMAAKLNATPAWADQEAIREIYAEAIRLTRETGIRHEVDHIYPLQGKYVCGLHVASNLQILTKTENIRKKNRMPEELGYA